MSKKLPDSLYYADDKDIADLLLSAKQKATSSRLLEFAQMRGLFFSPSDSREKLIERISKLTFSWPQLNELCELISTAERQDRLSNSQVSVATEPKQLVAILQELSDLRANDSGEAWSVTQEGQRVVLKVEYTDVNPAMTRIAQKTRKECTLEFAARDGKLHIRRSAQERSDQILERIVQQITEEAAAPVEHEEIDLSAIKSCLERTRFFLHLMDGLKDFRLYDVKTVKGSILAEGGSEMDEDLHSALEAEMTHAIRKIAFSGKGITNSPEYRQFFGDELTARFYVSSISWIAEEVSGSGIRAEFEALFSDADSCTGFTYMARRIWTRTVDGEMKRTARKPEAETKERLTRTLETAAYEAYYKVIGKKVEAQKNERKAATAPRASPHPAPIKPSRKVSKAASRRAP